jgi:hypothetical protein
MIVTVVLLIFMVEIFYFKVLNSSGENFSLKIRIDQSAGLGD